MVIAMRAMAGWMARMLTEPISFMNFVSRDSAAISVIASSASSQKPVGPPSPSPRRQERQSAKEKPFSSPAWAMSLIRG